MIVGLAKFMNLSLAPVLSTQFDELTANHIRLSVTRSHASHPSFLDGPSVFVGLLGSCARQNNSANVNCTASTMSPTYDISVLPSNVPDVLTAPTATTAGFIILSIFLTFFFFSMFTFTMLRHKMGKFGARFDNPTVHRATAWVGVFGFMTGLTSFLVAHMWFGKAVEDFNKGIAKGGPSSPQLMADISNGFTCIYVAYAFFAVPLVSSLAKLHVTATK